MSKPSVGEVLSTVATVLPFVEKLAAHIYHDGPEPEGLDQVPDVSKSAISLEKARVRMEKAERARAGSGV